jgi:hypothetical protein
LIVEFIEGLQAFDVDVLDVGALADGGFAVVVPREAGLHHALDQRA